MNEFCSYQSYREFSKSIKNKNRYIRNKDTESFFQTVIKTIKNRRTKIVKGSILWRAQIGFEWSEPIYEKEEEVVAYAPGPYSPKRMKPIPNEALEGRTNPKGISYLYLATDKETAMAEVRPWLGYLISVGQFIIKCNQTLIDCSKDYTTGFRIYFGEPDTITKEKEVWSDINKAFSKPITNADNKAYYAPTQVLAELFKANGFDGIVYKSALGNGKNVMLFDPESADLINCHLYEVKKLSFKFNQATNPYFVKKYYNNRRKT